MDTILLGIALLLSIAWLIIRIRQGKVGETSKKTSKLTQEKKAYHAVSINIEQSGCAAAKAMTGRRFLSSAAPQLPLPECDALECRCIFTHHADRRNNRDRRSPFDTGAHGSNATGSHERERRARQDRRKDADIDA